MLLQVSGTINFEVLRDLTNALIAAKKPDEVGWSICYFLFLNCSIACTTRQEVILNFLVPVYHFFDSLIVCELCKNMKMSSLLELK